MASLMNRQVLLTVMTGDIERFGQQCLRFLKSALQGCQPRIQDPAVTAVKARQSDQAVFGAQIDLELAARQREKVD